MNNLSAFGIRALWAILCLISFVGTGTAQFSIPAAGISFPAEPFPEEDRLVLSDPDLSLFSDKSLLSSAGTVRNQKTFSSSTVSDLPYSSGSSVTNNRSFIRTDREYSLFASTFNKKPHRDTIYEASPGIDPKLLTFEQRNSGAFKRKKKGGLKDPGMASLCSAVVPGLGQIYNGQWYKTPVIYAGAAVLAYFTDMNLKQRKIYDTEIRARTDTNTSAYNPELLSYSMQEILDLRNYYEQNFEWCIIIAGAVYLLNIIDAAVYAHLSSFNITPNLSMSIKPYARTNFAVRNSFPLDAGIRLCLTIK